MENAHARSEGAAAEPLRRVSEETKDVLYRIVQRTFDEDRDDPNAAGVVGARGTADALIDVLTDQFATMISTPALQASRRRLDCLAETRKHIRDCLHLNLMALDAVVRHGDSPAVASNEPNERPTADRA